MKKRISALSVLGLIFAIFLSPLGLILCIIDLCHKDREHGLSILGVVLSIVAIIIGVASYFAGLNKNSNQVSPAETLSAEQVTGQTETQQTTSAIHKESETSPADEIKAESSEPFDDSGMTLSQKSAVKSALDYLDYSAFSRADLIDQLSSEFGAKFPEEDAVFAVDFLENNNLVDWNEQAVKSAQDYLDYSAFSYDGLISQLTSEHGAQFTQEQAEYAVTYLEDHSLVDWNEQAAKAAKEYLDYSSFSRDSLLDQLTSEYGAQFTQEQAEQAASAVGY